MFVHGPVASVLAQRIEIDGFTESQPALSTSLAYPEQSYDSLIGSVGWQFSWSPDDRIHPYGRLTWDREFEDAPAQAFASAQSIPGSLQYAVPGHAFDERYGTLLIGDTHDYAATVEPFAAESTDRLLLTETARLLGVEHLDVIERWAGVYASAPDEFLVRDLDDRTTLVVVTSGIGMTTGLGLAARTLADRRR